MRHVIIAALVGAALATQARATDDDNADRARRARVALAGNVALNRVKAAAALAAPECGGLCRTDLDECRAEAKTSGKVLVLWVGGCKGRANDVSPAADVLNVRVPKYEGDKPNPPAPGQVAPVFDPAACRVVILARDVMTDPNALYVRATLPADVGAADLNRAVGEARKVAARQR